MALVSVLFTLILGAHRLPRLSAQVLESRGGEAGPSVVMQCEGSDVMLNKATLGVNIHHVFVSRGDESLASSSVAATGQFQDRLTVDSNGRVTLANLTVEDLGKYRVEVKLSEDKKIHSSIRLVISEPPATTDGKLLVNKMLSTGSDAVRLTCGHFTSLGFPAVSAVWKDPQGKIIPSDGFKEQAFYLDLPLSSAVSGDYCCHLDCRAPDFCCLDPQSPLRQCAPVHVQTETVEEVRKVDCPSLDSFSHLQQQVLDLVMAQRVQQESESHSGVATIAQLVQRQAKCDQLDDYMTRVEDVEEKQKKGLDAAMNHSTDFGRELETRLMNLQEIFRNQVTDDVDRLESNANSSRKTFKTRLEEMSRAMNDHQSQAGKHISDLENKTKTNFLDLRTDMDNNLSTTEGNLRLQLTEIVTNAAKLSDRLDRLDTSISSSQQTFQTRLEEMSRAMNDHQNRTDQHYADLQKELNKTFVDMQTEMDNKLARVEGRFTLKVSELVTTTAENLTRSAQDSDILKVGSASQMSELKDKLSTIQDTLTSHVTNSSQLIDSLRSDVSTTQSLKSGVCTSKSGYRSFNERCIKISNDEVNYQTAKANCLSEEAHLVILNSRDVDGPVLRAVMTATGITVPSPSDLLFFWVDADYFFSNDGSSVWNDRSHFLSTEYFWNYEDDEECAQMYINSDVLTLKDNDCMETFRYICEYELYS